MADVTVASCDGLATAPRQCPGVELSVRTAFGKDPVWSRVVAGVAVGIALKIILMLGLCFPEIAYRFEFRYHLARP